MDLFENHFVLIILEVRFFNQLQYHHYIPAALWITINKQKKDKLINSSLCHETDVLSYSFQFFFTVLIVFKKFHTCI